MTELKDVLKRYREIKTEAKALATAYSKRLTVIEDYLRVKLAESGSDTLKTSEGLVMQYERRTLKIVDISGFKAWCEEHGVDGLKSTLDSPEMTVWMDMNKGAEPPVGIEVSRTLVLSVKGTTDD